MGFMIRNRTNELLAGAASAALGVHARADSSLEAVETSLTSDEVALLMAPVAVAAILGAGVAIAVLKGGGGFLRWFRRRGGAFSWGARFAHRRPR